MEEEDQPETEVSPEPEPAVVIPLRPLNYPAEKPETYEECRVMGLGIDYPCPFASCNRHLALNVAANGSMSLHNEEWLDEDGVLDVTRMPETCLDGAIEKHPDGMTLQQVGDALGVTRERIRQMEAKIFRKLKAAKVSREVLAILASQDRELLPEEIPQPAPLPPMTTAGEPQPKPKKNLWEKKNRKLVVLPPEATKPKKSIQQLIETHDRFYPIQPKVVLETLPEEPETTEEKLAYVDSWEMVSPVHGEEPLARPIEDSDEWSLSALAKITEDERELLRQTAPRRDPFEEFWHEPVVQPEPEPNETKPEPNETKTEPNREPEPEPEPEREPASQPEEMKTDDQEPTEPKEETMPKEEKSQQQCSREGCDRPVVTTKNGKYKNADGVPTDLCAPHRKVLLAAQRRGEKKKEGQCAERGCQEMQVNTQAASFREIPGVPNNLCAHHRQIIKQRNDRKSAKAPAEKKSASVSAPADGIFARTQAVIDKAGGIDQLEKIVEWFGAKP